MRLGVGGSTPAADAAFVLASPPDHGQRKTPSPNQILGEGVSLRGDDHV